jgi:hypothetical protein
MANMTTDGQATTTDRQEGEALRAWRPQLRSLVNRLTLAEESATSPPAEADAPAVPEPVDGGPVPTRQIVRLVVALVAGLTGSLILVATAPQWWLAPDGWRFTLPGLEPGRGRSSIYFGALFLLGVLLLAGGWLGLLGYTSRRVGTARSRLWLVVGATALWALPFAVSLPQLSTDVYAYGAQGYLATQGYDPSSVPVDVLPRDSCMFDERCYLSSTDSIWRKDPAPYGPVGVAVAELAVIGSGYKTFLTTYAFRFVAMLGVAMAGIGVYQIARRRNVDEAMALAIAVANPVVMIHLIGGAHNDALMMGLLLLGLASWEGGRKILAVVLITLATCVKLPAILALGYLAWNWWGDHRNDDWRQRLKGSAIVGGIAVGLVGVLCLVVGIGLGWLSALSSTNKVVSTFSFFTKAGFVTSDLLAALGLVDDPAIVTAVFRYVGLAIAAVVMLAVLRRSPSIGVTKSSGIALLALMLLAPVVWPWYLPVTFALLAAVGVRRYRPTLIVLVIASSLLVWPSSVQSIEALNRYQHWLGLLVVCIIAGCCVAAQYMARASERGRELGGLKVPTIEAVLITSSVAPSGPAVGASAPAGSVPAVSRTDG